MASEYTKHYYIERQRIASKIGGGRANSMINFNNIDETKPIYSDYLNIPLSLLGMCKRADECTGFVSTYNEYGKELTCIKELAEKDENEPDLYHSDHIGSSSFITDRTGIASQHLQYLPFGELFVEQRSTANYYTPYKFSGKEKDEETSYSYFGARYYLSDISVWASVDPLADQAPGWTPYRYCFNNPIMLTDPDGRFEGGSGPIDPFMIKCPSFNRFSFSGLFKHLNLRHLFWYKTTQTYQYTPAPPKHFDASKWNAKFEKSFRVNKSAELTFESYQIEDQLIIYKDGHEIINTGSVGTDNEPLKFELDKGNYKIVVNPNTNPEQQDKGYDTKFDINITKNEYRVKFRQIDKLWGFIPIPFSGKTRTYIRNSSEHPMPTDRIRRTGGKRYF